MCSYLSSERLHPLIIEVMKLEMSIKYKSVRYVFKHKEKRIGGHA